MNDKLLNSNFVNLRGINIDLGNQCNLSCPGCRRTSQIRLKQFVPYTMTVEDFSKIVNDTNNIQLLNLCGAHSDIIYATYLFDILEYINTLKNRPKIFFSTNGSGRKTEWWEKFAASLTGFNIVQFAVDGLEDTNHIYRIGSKWDTIENGMRTFRKSVKKSTVRMDWAFCVFEHNYHQIFQAYDLSKEIGFDTFKLKLGDIRTPPEMVLKSAKFEDLAKELADYKNKK